MEYADLDQVSPGSHLDDNGNDSTVGVFVVCRRCGCERPAGERCDNCDDPRGRETDIDDGGREMIEDYDERRA